MYANDCFPGSCFCSLGPSALSIMDVGHSPRIGSSLPSRLNGGSPVMDPGREILYWYTVNKSDLAEFLGLKLDCPKDLHPQSIMDKPYGGYYSMEDRDQRSYELITRGRRSYWHRRFTSGKASYEEVHQHDKWGEGVDPGWVYTTLPRDVMDTVLDGTASTLTLWRLEGSLVRLFLSEDGFPEKHMYLLLWLAVAQAKGGVETPSTVLADALIAVSWRRTLWTCDDHMQLRWTVFRYRFVHSEESMAWDKVVESVFKIGDSWNKSMESLSCGVHEHISSNVSSSTTVTEQVAHANPDEAVGLGITLESPVLANKEKRRRLGSSSPLKGKTRRVCAKSAPKRQRQRRLVPA